MRYELKFNIPYSSLPKLTQWMATHKGIQKSYPDRMVSSIYFDTLSLDCAYDNLCGISNREKYRIRWYQSDGSIYGARYELKRKEASLGSKEVIKTSDAIANLMNRNSWDIKQVLDNEDIGRIWPQKPLLFPTLFVQYIRSYYESFQEIRLTVDTHLNFLEMLDDNHLCPGKEKGYGGVIVEIKFYPIHRDLIAEMLKDFPYYPVRTSKYVLGLSYFGRVNYI